MSRQYVQGQAMNWKVNAT